MKGWREALLSGLAQGTNYGKAAGFCGAALLVPGLGKAASGAVKPLGRREYFPTKINY